MALTRRRLVRAPAIALALAAAGPAHASFLARDALDTAADVLSWVILVIVPVIGITVFWMVHVLPEKIAHKRHHPQRNAIQTLCLLSLVFGGLLWPIAWLSAFTRPIAFKTAYGTDKHEDYFLEQRHALEAGKHTEAEVVHLDKELAALESHAALTPELQKVRDAVTAHRRATAAAPTPEAA